MAPESMPEVIRDRTLLAFIITAQLKAVAKKRNVESSSKLKQAD